MSITRSGALPPWLLLVFTLPRRGASLRVAVWRKLQRYGALPLGNSGYLLPNTPESRERLEWLATTIRSGHGEASLVEVQSIDNVSGDQLAGRFSELRAREYRDLLREIRRVQRAPKGNHSPKQLSRLQQRFQDVLSIDFFGSPLRGQVERALANLQNPEPTRSEIGNISRTAFRNKVWVTRFRPGVDRVGSAWLIRKFIDPNARFTFSAEDKKPRGAVPFDMYEGGFGHRGEDCTFETLRNQFRIRDRKVGVIAQIVHDADLLDEKFGRKQGFGIDEVMKGWARQRVADKELLERGMQLIEGLYHSVS